MSRQRKGKENEAVHGVGTFGKIVSYVVMILVCFISLFPVIWVAISSLKADPLAEPGFTLPSALCFDGYIGVFRDMHIMRYFFNSGRYFCRIKYHHDFHVSVCCGKNEL